MYPREMFIIYCQNIKYLSSMRAFLIAHLVMSSYFFKRKQSERSQQHKLKLRIAISKVNVIRG